MITKGTAEYKQAQELANSLQFKADLNPHSDRGFDQEWELEVILDAVIEANVFASQIAETVKKSVKTPYRRTVAKMSSKQAWILAAGIVENNIDIKAYRQARLDAIVPMTEEQWAEIGL